MEESSDSQLYEYEKEKEEDEPYEETTPEMSKMIREMVDWSNELIGNKKKVVYYIKNSLPTGLLKLGIDAGNFIDFASIDIMSMDYKHKKRIAKRLLEKSDERVDWKELVLVYKRQLKNKNKKKNFTTPGNNNMQNNAANVNQDETVANLDSKWMRESQKENDSKGKKRKWMRVKYKCCSSRRTRNPQNSENQVEFSVLLLNYLSGCFFCSFAQLFIWRLFLHSCSIIYPEAFSVLLLNYLSRGFFCTLAQLFS
jgi:hypothetical protein